MSDESRTPRLPSGAPQKLVVARSTSRAFPQEGPYPDRPSDADIGGIGDVLRRRRGMILLVLLVVLGSAVTLTLLWPKTYESTALVLVEERRPRLESSPLAVLERLGQGSQIETEMELMKSRRVVERLVDDLDLHVLVKAPVGKRRPLEVFPTFEATAAAQAGSYRFALANRGRVNVTDLGADSLVATIAGEFDLIGLRGSLPDPFPAGGIDIEVVGLSQAVEVTQRRIVTRRVGRQADLVRMTCSGPTPGVVQDLCQRTLNGYMELRTELQRTEATVTAKFLREQGERVGAQLAVAEDSLEAYGRVNRVVALEERANAEVTQYTQLKAQRDQMDAERVALAAMIRDMESGGGTRKYRDIASFPTFLRNAAVTEMLTSLIGLENRRSDLATRRSAGNADVAALDIRIGDIERQLRGMAVSYERALGQQIATLDGTLVSTAGRLAVIPTQQVQHARLQRKATLLDDLYRVLQARLREAEVAEAVELPSVRVVDAASLPFQPASPNLPRNLALSLALAVLSGLGAALFAEAKDTRVRERQQVERQTGLPVLTIVPHLIRPGSVMPLLSPPRTAGAGARGKWRKQDARRDARRPTADAQVALECFRSLAADLGFAGRATGNGGFRSVAITSAGREEGKTLTACNLALVRAADGVRTLLIDGDMRGGRVARFFGFTTSSPGLSDVLAGSVEIDRVWQGVAGQPVLWVLPAGTPTPHSTTLLGSEAFARILEWARMQFDLIIVDTPPLNVISDAATVAALADAVIVVVREGKTERDALEMTLARLGRAGGNVVGVVLNDVSLTREHVGGYAYTPATRLG